MNRSNAGANLPTLRSHNAALVLDLLRVAGERGISRLELAERTGLTPQAVSKITARLRAEGLATEAGHRASTGGKPRTVLRLVPDAGHAVGLHLDRDELTVVLVDLAGTVVASRRTPLDFGAPAGEVVAVAAGEVGAVLGGPAADAVAGSPQPRSFPEPGAGPRTSAASAPGEGGAGGAAPVGDARTVLGIGVAVPGPLDHRGGVLHRVTGFPQWDGYPLQDALAARTGLPVVVDKDTNAAALGLALRADGPGDFAYLHLGTGLGAGLFLGGALHRGARTGAGEFGHQTVSLDGPLCSCGGRGCIEALCLAAVADGEVAEAARVLGTGAANLVGLLDIDRVVLGGRTVGADPDAYVRGVRAVIEERARRDGTGAAVPLVTTAGAGRPVAEGAAQLVLAPLFGRVGSGGGA
ncbi:ROK family transcriptional regulator [Streptomyces sp. NBC_01799]|uniref:ROK family transcriptional regulator n=1 Tax=Streptomyces sp. NBC_01800 TaxID=2975945 RepID=UPI002DD9ADEF|nr:ROK family transcriptional regulator [Streptomyces sp. NBC_01800]WSA68388.1 ROK family transcriptional regulator [Streptomyces sp. NBC_01800]WSA76993.1 ROK family transcriptional regulator [Streptomyces sp. NBC_01799]